MRGLDTNVLIRYLTADDPAQSAMAKTVMDSLTEDEPGYVSLVALLETVWLLTRTYRIGRSEVARTVTALLASPRLVVQERDAVQAAIDLAEPYGCTLADALLVVLGTRAGCRDTLTFDRRAARLPGVHLIDGEQGDRQRSAGHPAGLR